MTRLFCVLMLGAAGAAAQTVEGSVLNSVTGSGIAGVTVDIVQKGNKVYSTTTDTQGHFLVEGVKAGSYAVQYSSPDHWPSDPGYPWPYQPGLGSYPRFQMTAGGNPVKLVLRMLPLPTLTGRIVDGKGEPIPGAALDLDGPATGRAYKADAKGRFEAHQYLLPDAYRLWVTPPFELKPPDPEPDGRALGWTQTFYPGVAQCDAASKVVLRPGDVRDIEIKLLAVPAHAVRGVLLNPDGEPAPKTEVSLTGPANLTTESKPDGTFEFPVVVDGEWRLLAEPNGAHLQASQWIEMTGHEIENVKLRLNPSFTVRFKVVMDTPKGMPAPKPPQIQLASHVTRSMREMGHYGRGSPQALTDGDFSFEGIYPGFYSINAFAPPGYYLDSVRVGDAEVTTQEVEISGPVSAAVVFKTNGGTIRGTVENCASGVVMLFPTDPSTRRWGFVRTATCDSNDRYQITGMRPGEYYALAFSAFSSADYFRLWNMVMLDESLLKQAGSVTVGAGETSAADLRAITVPPGSNP